MDRRFAKFTEVKVDYCNKKSSNELMVDTSSIIAIQKTELGTRIVMTEDEFDVIESFEEVRRILAI